MSGLDPQYITGPELQDYFVNKNTGLPLAGGKVYFWKDRARNYAKPVYQLVQGSNNPPQYSYEPLPNPMTLSNVGTYVDNSNNNIAVYFYPYDENGDEELYYIEWYDALGKFQGVFQGSREAWPYPNGANENNNVEIADIVSNQITNPSFINVLFTTPTLTLNYTGTGNQTINFAPGWQLYFAYSGDGTLTITQNAVLGNRNLLNNPPYTLDFNIGANISSIYIQQTLNINPDWAATSTFEPEATGWLSGSILIGPGTTVTMEYLASSGNVTPQEILSETNTNTGENEYEQVNATIQLDTANSSVGGSSGYDLIRIVLPTSGTASISNVQVVSLNDDIGDVAYEQTTSNRQVDQMFNYYKGLLEYKPLNSYLVGWDFPLNPAQALGWTQSAQTLGGVNLSRYILDQTILYTAVDNSIAISQSTNGDLVITASADTQFALIQYLDGFQVQEILSSDLSSAIKGFTSQSGGITATASLWYTVGSQLPNVASGSWLSLVDGLNSTGYVTDFNQASSGSWTEVFRSGINPSGGSASQLGPAQFTLPYSETSNYSFIPLSGWGKNNNTSSSSATYFAYVLGFSTLKSGQSVTLRSISLVPGNIATVPAPKTLGDVLFDVQRYYRMTFNIGTVPQQGIGSLGYGEIEFTTTLTTPGSTKAPTINFSPQMRALGNVIFYNPLHSNAQAVQSVPSYFDCSNTIVYGQSLNTMGCETVAGSGVNVGEPLAVHFTIDARLGIVL
jgi:hypothetical protein